MPWDVHRRRQKKLLAGPLYLHIFHETWKEQVADLRGLSGEQALFEAYLDALNKIASSKGRE